MRIFTVLLVLLSSLHLVSASTNDNGRWKFYLSYYNTQQVAETDESVYGVANGGLYVYGKTDKTVRFLSKLTGLSGTDVSNIAYNPTTKNLLVVYSDGNIDLMGESGIYNMPYLKNTTNIQDKTVNNINIVKTDAYLSTAFGVMVIRMDKREIAETYRLNKDTVYAATVYDNKVYAMTSSGLLAASTNSNLLDASNWTVQSVSSSDLKPTDAVGMGVFQNQLCIGYRGKGVFYRSSDGVMHDIIKNSNLTGVEISTDQLIANSSEMAYFFSSLTDFEYYSMQGINGVSSLKSGKYWLAAGERGLIGISRKASNQYDILVSDLQINNSPKRHLAWNLTFNNNQLYLLGGGRATNRYNNPGTLSIYNESEWDNLDETLVTKKVGYACNDYLDIAIDPTNPTHYFVSSYGEGVLEFNDNVFRKLYTIDNSPLLSAVSGNKNYVRIGGIAFDKSNNLWMANCDVNNGLAVRTSEGTWASLYYPALSGHYYISQILVTSKGHKWIVVPHTTSSSGIFVLDDNGTPTNTSDDIYQYHKTLNTASGSIEISKFNCVAEDKDGAIWIGTNKGPIISSSPANALKDNFYCSRIIVKNEFDENAYFLGDATITAIAVDGGNRKWLGTAGAGLFLVSPDGTKTIYEFTEENSPLISNTINSIAIDDKTGEVFIGTDVGMVSYRGGATEGKTDYSDVYAYPNPVRLSEHTEVTITGLMSDSNVKITDLNGNLIYQATSAGGQLTWNCLNRSGKRVSSGIYLVIVASSDGDESVASKIAIVN